MKLLNSQKNMFYDILEEIEKFSPSQFDIDDTIDEFKLIYRNTEYLFSLTENIHWNIHYIPATNKYQHITNTSSWSEVINNFRSWLYSLLKEVSQPNKWDRLAKEMNNIRGIVQADNTMFSHSEYMTLTQQMNEIKESLITISLTAEQNEAIEAKLDHLLILANELNKFDWQGLFIGTIMSIIIQLNVTPENAHALTTMMHQIFNRLFLN
jgi:hypothetical protein